MTTIKRLVCLANSRKLSGRCIAGKELVDGRPAGWIRPVSAREHEEVSEDERQYGDGSDPRVLDIMNVAFLGPRPKGYQQENWLLEPGQCWARTGQATWGHLKRLADPVEALWINGYSTRNGLNDHVPLSLAGAISTSLRFIRVDLLKIAVCVPGEAFGDLKRKVQGHFSHDNTEYRLWVTDPTYERTYLAKPDGNYEIGECYLTISLGEPFKDACYKLIAAIIPHDSGSSA